MLQTLKTEILGKTQGYQAVPGCGLQCTVTQIDGVLVDIDLEGVNNRKNLMGSTKVMTDNVLFDGEEITATIEGQILSHLLSHSIMLSHIFKKKYSLEIRFLITSLKLF